MYVLRETDAVRIVNVTMVKQKSTMIYRRNLLLLLTLGLFSQEVNGFISQARICAKKPFVRSMEAVKHLSCDSRQRTNLRMSLYDEGEGDRQRTELTNKVLKASRSSFRHVEGHTFRLLDEQPMLAMALFIGVGLLVMYMTGFAFLGGYISSPNPLENGAVPYWDEDLSTMP